MVSSLRSSAPGRIASLVALALVLAGTHAGCSLRSDAEIAAAEGRSMGPIPVSAPGPLRLVGEAFAEVPLDPEQRPAISALMKEVDARHVEIGKAMRAAAAALAAQIEAGAIDRAALRPAIDAVADAMAKAQAPDRAAIERLHGMLDIEQRQMLADAMEDRIEAATARRELDDKWTLWKVELALTESQRDAIAHDVIDRIGWGWGWHWGHEPPAHALLQDFPEDGFELDEVAPQLDLHALVAARSARVLDVVEAALPHLTAAQRKTAARLIRTRGDTDLP